MIYFPIFKEDISIYLQLWKEIMKNVYKNIIADFHERGVPDSFEREYRIPLNSGKIITLIGARRAGKTFLLYHLIKQINNITDVIYINFEDERIDTSKSELQEIISAYLELYPDKKLKELYLFFDEIQVVTGWEKFVRRIDDTITKRIFITGSSAKLLSKEIATSLRGRTLTFEVFPLTFSEYLKFRNVRINLSSTLNKALVIHELNEFLIRGSFPEAALLDKNYLEKTLQEYFNVMLYRDVAERYQIQNLNVLKYILKKTMINTGNIFSVNKIYNELLSAGLKSSKDSLYEYIEYFQDAFIVFPISAYKESINNFGLRKSYSIDWALSSVLSYNLSEDIGKIFETMIFLEFRKRFENIYFYRNGFECDILIHKKNTITHCFQICYALNEQNMQRELKGLKKTMERFSLQKGMIITFEQEKSLQENISVIPAYKFLLEPDSYLL